MTAILSLGFVFVARVSAQDGLPPVPSFNDPSEDSLPPLPGLDSVPVQNPAPNLPPAAVKSNGNPANDSVLSDPAFQANLRKPFVGQIQGTWPPTFSNSGIASSQIASSKPQAPVTTSYKTSVPDVPPLPNAQPAPAPVNPPVAYNPSGRVAGGNLDNPRQLTPPGQPNQPYSSPTIAPIESQPPIQQTRPPAQAHNTGFMFKGGSICPLNIRPTKPGEHPMAALIPWATEGIQTFNSKIKDYSCVMIKRERIDGQLQESSTLFMKIREQPFSIYVKYLKPDKKAGVEALYRKGYHNDQLLGHDVGFRAIAGSLWLDPNGRLAMAGQKYPITDGGIPNLVRKMMDTVKLDMKNDPEGKETFVKFVEDGGKIDGRPCIRIDVMHPVRRSCYRFHRAEILLDKEWGIPVRYAAWMWPAYQGGKPVLDEEFTYTQLKFNRGFTDWDFNERNREYKF